MESNDAYDVHTSLTGYEPQRHGLQRARQLPRFLLLHYPVIGPGQDDATLGKLLDEAHREHADYRNPGGVSVSQPVVIVCRVQ